MTPQEYVSELEKIQKPLKRQQDIVQKIAAVHGTNSWQYRQEFAKECQIVQANYVKEVALYWQMMTGLYKNLIPELGKDKVLEQVILKGKSAREQDKPGWRIVYQNIKNS